MTKNQRSLKTSWSQVTPSALGCSPSCLHETQLRFHLVYATYLRLFYYFQQNLILTDILKFSVLLLSSAQILQNIPVCLAFNLHPQLSHLPTQKWPWNYLLWMIMIIAPSLHPLPCNIAGISLHEQSNLTHPLTLGLAIWHALAKKMRQKWWCARSKPRF